MYTSKGTFIVITFSIYLSLFDVLINFLVKITQWDDCYYLILYNNEETYPDITGWPFLVFL